MNNPLVTVVIPTYKGVYCVMTAVLSVAAQSYRNIETIVVIDGSNDGTLELLESYRATLPSAQKANFKIINQKNSGVSAARNAGMKEAQGQYIALLDHDDTWETEKITAQIDEISRCSEHSGIFCTTDNYVFDQNSGKRDHQRNGDSLTIVGLLRNTGAQPGTWVFSKNILQLVGMFDEQLCVAEDGDFLLRILADDNIKCVNVDRPLSTYNIGNENSLASSINPKKIDSFVKAFIKSYDLLQQKLPPELLEVFMDWHRQNIPDNLLADAMRQIEKKRTNIHQQHDCLQAKLPSEYNYG